MPHRFLKHLPLENDAGPRTFVWEGWLERGHYLHVYPTSLPPMRFAGPKEQMRQDEYKGPAAVVHWVEVDGPIIEEWPPPGHRLLWDDLPTRPRADAAANPDLIAHLDAPPARIAQPRMTRVKTDKATGNRYVYDPERQTVGGEPIHRAAPIPKPLNSTRELVAKQPRRDAERLLVRFANRAFRRPVERAEIVPVLKLVHRWMDEGQDFERAMRVGYKALLTSPGFLYHRASLPDSAPELDAHALSERLAFFLWNGLPGGALLDAAADGSLAEPTVLRRRRSGSGKPDQVEARIQGLLEGQSIMDTVLEQTRSVGRRLGREDREKFEEYLTSLREVERQMVRQQAWERTPKPKVRAKPPRDIQGNADVTGKAKLLFDLAHLALETDSTRIITILMQGDFLVPPIEGVSEGYHTVSHHGQNKGKINQLAMIEEEHVRQLKNLLGKLKRTKEDGATLLDRTMVLYGSNLGNASSRDNRNLPVILAGGGFKHGQHLGFDRDDNYSLSNLYVSMLQRLGIEADRFSSSKGTMTGLEMKA